MALKVHRDWVDVPRSSCGSHEQIGIGDLRRLKENHMAVVVLGFLGLPLTVFTFCRLVTCRLAQGSVTPDDWGARKQVQRRLTEEASDAAWILRCPTS
jgi:hypothetical protein